MVRLDTWSRRHTLGRVVTKYCGILLEILETIIEVSELSTCVPPSQIGPKR